MYCGCLWGWVLGGCVLGGCVSIGNKSPSIPRMRTASQVSYCERSSFSSTGHRRYCDCLDHRSVAVWKVLQNIGNKVLVVLFLSLSSILKKCLSNGISKGLKLSLIYNFSFFIFTTASDHVFF